MRNIRRLRSLRSVDDGVGRMIRLLDAIDELDNTYIFFMSDNGFELGEHRISKGKFRPYQESSHVPLIVRGPGIPHGKVSRELVTNVDIAPTIAAIAGAEPTRLLDGRSLLPLRPGAQPPQPPPDPARGLPPRKERPEEEGHGATSLPEPTPPNWQAIVRGPLEADPLPPPGLRALRPEEGPVRAPLTRRRAPLPQRFPQLRRGLKHLKHCAGDGCNRPTKAPKAP